MERHNDFDLVKRILARWLPASVSREREDCRAFPSVKRLALAEKLMYLVDSCRTKEEVVKTNSRLIELAPVWSKGRWVTRGRLGKGMMKVFKCMIEDKIDKTIDPQQPIIQWMA